MSTTAATRESDCRWWMFTTAAKQGGNATAHVIGCPRHRQKRANTDAQKRPLSNNNGDAARTLVVVNSQQSQRHDAQARVLTPTHHRTRTKPDATAHTSHHSGTPSLPRRPRFCTAFFWKLSTAPQPQSMPLSTICVTKQNQKNERQSPVPRGHCALISPIQERENISHWQPGSSATLCALLSAPLPHTCLLVCDLPLPEPTRRT